VEIVLYGIGEQRLSMPDLHEVTVDSKELVWDFATESANYPELRRRALARNLGFSTLTSFADRGAFSKQYRAPDDSTTVTYQLSGQQASGQVLTNFADLYFAQAAANAGSLRACPSLVTQLARDELVQEIGTPSALAASSFACGEFTDIAQALTGMHPARVWLTRFELDLPREALSRDCVVTPSESQETVTNALLATHFANAPASCEQPIFESRLATGSPARTSVWLSVLAVTALGWLRRQMRKAGR
jgi:hypothetical protein